MKTGVVSADDILVITNDYGGMLVMKSLEWDSHAFKTNKEAHGSRRILKMERQLRILVGQFMV
jgi:hypothetical protein